MTSLWKSERPVFTVQVLSKLFAELEVGLYKKGCQYSCKKWALCSVILIFTGCRNSSSSSGSSSKNILIFQFQLNKLKQFNKPQVPIKHEHNLLGSVKNIIWHYFFVSSNTEKIKIIHFMSALLFELLPIVFNAIIYSPYIESKVADSEIDPKSMHDV